MKLPAEEGDIKRRFDKARRAGYEVFKHKGYTDYAIAACASMIVNAIVRDTREVFPISTLVDGPYGIKDVCLSLPCIIGRRGVLRVLTPDLSPSEEDELRGSAGVLKKALAELH